MNTFLGCEVVFGASTDEIAFPGIVEQMPVVSADPYLDQLLVKYCEEAVTHRQAGRATLRLDVTNAIAPVLPHGKARMDEIAAGPA